VSEEKPGVPSVGDTSGSVGVGFSLNSKRLPMTEISRKMPKSNLDSQSQNHFSKLSSENPSDDG
jgi:hypothetical protein